MTRITSSLVLITLHGQDQRGVWLSAVVDETHVRARVAGSNRGEAKTEALQVQGSPFRAVPAGQTVVEAENPGAFSSGVGAGVATTAGTAPLDLWRTKEQTFEMTPEIPREEKRLSQPNSG